MNTDVSPGSEVLQAAQQAGVHEIRHGEELVEVVLHRSAGLCSSRHRTQAKIGENTARSDRTQQQQRHNPFSRTPRRYGYLGKGTRCEQVSNEPALRQQPKLGALLRHLFDSAAPPFALFAEVVCIIREGSGGVLLLEVCVFVWFACVGGRWGRGPATGSAQQTNKRRSDRRHHSNKNIVAHSSGSTSSTSRPF